jgi:hypothetical protein
MNVQVLMIIITVAGIVISFAVILSIFLGKKIEDSAGRQKLSLFGKLELEANTLVMLLALGILQTLAPVGVMVWKPELFRPAPATSMPLTLNITGTVESAEDGSPDPNEPVLVQLFRREATDSLLREEEADPTEFSFYFQEIPILSETDRFRIVAQQGDSLKDLKELRIALQHVKMQLRKVN